MNLFDNIIHFSLELKKGERVFIFADDKSKEYCKQFCNELQEFGAVPVVVWNDVSLNESFILHGEKDLLNSMYDAVEKTIRMCDVAVMFDNNIENYKDFNPKEVLKFKNEYYLKIFQKIMTFERWVYLRYPQKELANLFQISYEEHEKLLFDVNNFNYEALTRKATKLKDILDRTNKIQILGVETDLMFTKKNISTVVCCGKINLPDGEVYTAPEKYSVNGKILFDVDSYFRGVVYKNIKFEVKDGKIINYSCNENEALGNILSSDEGASYFGEFAVGLNPFITKNYNDNLFNEKMVRTIHMAIGNSHSDSKNGNESIIHWDLIKDMSKDCEMWFDDKLVYKNGQFIITELEDLFSIE